jgi:hypothetical protein
MKCENGRLCFMPGTELQFHGSSEREHRTKVVTNKELKSIQKFTVIIIT